MKKHKGCTFFGTCGKNDRVIPEKMCRSIQLDEETARRIYTPL